MPARNQPQRPRRSVPHILTPGESEARTSIAGHELTQAYGAEVTGLAKASREARERDKQKAVQPTTRLGAGAGGGPNGSPGSPGVKGDKGDKGDTGDTGPIGPTEPLRFAQTLSKTITAHVNDLADAGLAAATVIYLTSTLSEAQIRGITAPGTDGTVKFFVNVGTPAIRFMNDHASATAANRMLFANNAGTKLNRYLVKGQALALIYRNADSRWHELVGPMSAEGLDGTVSGGTALCSLLFNYFGYAAGHPELAYDYVSKGFIVENLVANGAVALSGILTPAQITSNQTDYHPSGLENNVLLRLSSDAARSILSLVYRSPYYYEGEFHLLFNVGSYTITLEDQYTVGTTAAMRFAFGGTDLAIPPSGVALIFYDPTTARWRGGLLSGAGGAGLPAALTAGAIPFWNGSAWLAGLIVTDTTNGVLLAADGSVMITEDV